MGLIYVRGYSRVDTSGKEPVLSGEMVMCINENSIIMIRPPHYAYSRPSLEQIESGQSVPESEVKNPDHEKLSTLCYRESDRFIRSVYVLGNVHQVFRMIKEYGEIDATRLGGNETGVRIKEDNGNGK